MSGSPDEYGTEPMFDVPEPYRVRPRKGADPLAVRWTKASGRFTCDLCIMNLHDGISDTPLSHAKHTYIKGERRWMLCSVHAAQIRNNERRLG